MEVSGTVANDKADIKIVVDAAGLKSTSVLPAIRSARIPGMRWISPGLYGKMIVTVGDTPVGPTKQGDRFRASERECGADVVEDFSFGGASLGKIVLSDVNVAKKDAGYTVAGEGDVKCRSAEIR